MAVISPIAAARRRRRGIELGPAAEGYVSQAGGYGDDALLSEIGDDERRRALKFKRQFQDSYRNLEEWTCKAIESYEFMHGKQWLDEDLEYLQNEGRPNLTLNRLLAPVLFLSGIQRQSRTDVKLVPFESGDARASALMTALYKWHATESREAWVDARVFHDIEITGLGWWKTTLDFERTITGEPRKERVSPLSVFPDPNFFAQYDWRAAQYVHHAYWLTIDEAMEQWPEHEDHIRRLWGEWLRGGEGSATSSHPLGVTVGDSHADRRLFWDAETQRVRCIEVWYKQRMVSEIAVDRETGELYTQPAAVARLQQALAAQFLDPSSVFFARRPVTIVRMAHVLHEYLLDDGPSPYAEPALPLTPAVGFLWWGDPFGLVEPAKDPQREHNRRRTTIMEIARKLPNNTWLNPDNAAKTEDVERAATGVARVLNYNATKGEPKIVQAPGLPDALVYLDRESRADIQNILNITPELVGNVTQRTISGKAIRARQQGGMVVQEPLLDEYRLAKREADSFFLAAVQQYTSPSKARRILGALLARPAVMAGINPEELRGVVGDQNAYELEQLLVGALSQRYDLVISEETYDPSGQQVRAQTIAELAETFAPYVPGDVVVDALVRTGTLTEDEAARIKERVKLVEQLQLRGGAPAAGPGAPPGPEGGIG